MSSVASSTARGIPAAGETSDSLLAKRVKNESKLKQDKVDKALANTTQTEKGLIGFSFLIHPVVPLLVLSYRVGQYNAAVERIAALAEGTEMQEVATLKFSPVKPEEQQQ